MRFNGENGQWQEYVFPSSNDEDKGKTAKKDNYLPSSVYENVDNEDNTIQVVELTGRETDFLAILNNQELYSSRNETTLDHKNVNEFVIFPDKTNPQTVIITESEIWLYGDKNEMVLEPIYDETLHGFKAAKDYLKRCLNEEERNKLRVGKEMPCFCKDKYPYNIGKTWEKLDDEYKKEECRK